MIGDDEVGTVCSNVFVNVVFYRAGLRCGTPQRPPPDWKYPTISRNTSPRCCPRACACMGFHSLPTVYVHARDVDETANPDKSAVYEFGRKHKGAALSHKHSCTKSYQQSQLASLAHRHPRTRPLTIPAQVSATFSSRQANISGQSGNIAQQFKRSATAGTVESGTCWVRLYASLAALDRSR